MRGKILKGTLILTLSSIVDMGIRLLYQASVASRFGADAAMDAYFAATTVPNLIGEALIGSLSITLIPVFIDYLVHQDKREAWRVVSCICNVTVLILSLTSGLAVALGSQVVRWTVPGFEASRSQLAVHLLRIESWTLPFLALKSLLAGVYYARDEFLIPSLAKALQSTVRVLFVLFFGEFVGVIGIAWADLLGVSVDVAMLLPVWLRRGRFYLTFDLRHPGARRTLSLMLPYVIGAFIGKANPLIARFLASYLSAGSISYLAYAERIKTVAATILGSGITQSIFPTLSAIHSERRYDLLGHTVERAIQWVLYLVLPVVAILVALRVPIVQTMFERGEFSRCPGWYHRPDVLRDAGHQDACDHHQRGHCHLLCYLSGVASIPVLFWGCAGFFGKNSF
jgi:putative peptidoglycan lipid II flippase